VEREADVEAERIQEVLAHTFNSGDYAPPVLPAAALEVHRLSQQTSVEIHQVLAALEKDPMLAARVLKIASSPVFSSLPVVSLHSAVVRLGLMNLTNIVWEVSTNLRVFRSKAYAAPMESVRKHSTACAYISRVVAKRTSVSLDYAFLCGLLHDVGVAAALLVLSTDPSIVIGDEVLAVALRSIHADASSVVARLWRLPADLQLVLGHHHLVSIQGHVHPVAAVVAVAEELAEELGFGLEFGNQKMVDATPSVVREQAHKALDLNEQSWAALRKEAEVTLKQLSSAEGTT